MIETVTYLVVFQLAGEVLVRLVQVPIPGPVVGMALFATTLAAFPNLAAGIQETVDGLLANLGLLFVPAGVGVCRYLGLLKSEWLPITVALLVSAVAGIVVTGLVFHALLRPRRGTDEQIIGRPLGPTFD